MEHHVPSTTGMETSETTIISYYSSSSSPTSFPSRPCKCLSYAEDWKLTDDDDVRLIMFLKSVQRIQTAEATKRWSVTFTEHQTAVTKVSGLLFLVQVGCWTPYAVLCLWTIILPPESLNVHYTLLPSVCCKVVIDSLFTASRDNNYNSPSSLLPSML